MLNDPSTPPEKDAIPVDWHVPAARAGLAGQWDQFIGPGATRAETWLILGLGVLLALAILAYNLTRHSEWTFIQQAVVFLVAFDIAGGVIANAAAPGKRWYHRRGYGMRSRMLFIVFHAFHPAVITLALAPYQWQWFAFVYGYLLLAAIALLFVPVYLQRPLSVGLFALGVVLGLWFPFPLEGLSWFVPLFYAKLLIAYLVREEPYRTAAVT